MTDLVRSIGRMAWQLFEYLSMVLGLLYFSLVCIAWMPFALIFAKILPRRLGRAVGRKFIMFGFRSFLRFLTVFCGFRFDLEALDALRNEGPMVIVANHPSLMDIVMIASRFPNMVCIMKAALMDNLLLGAAARLARYIPNDAPLEVILRAREALGEGADVLVFPEGTRTHSFPMDRCKASAGLIARQAGVPVQALLIEFSSPYLGKNWPLFRRPELPLQFSIRVGRRFAPPSDVAAFAGELDTYFGSELCQSPAEFSGAQMALR